MIPRMSKVEGASRPISVGRAGLKRWSLALVAMGATAGLAASMAVPATASQDHGSRGFRQINLVSDQPGVAPLTDPDLVNAWGLSASPGTDAAPGRRCGCRTTARTRPRCTPALGRRSVSKVPGGRRHLGAPTGQVFNTDPTGFVVHDAAGNSGSARFIFDSENGGDRRLEPDRRRHRPRAVDGDRGRGEQRRQRGVQGPGHRHGLGRAHLPVRRQLPVRAGRGLRRHVHPGRAARRAVRRPRIPAGYAPFNVQELAGKLYVTYAKQDATLHDDVAGQGHGFVDVFTNDGAFVRRLVTRGVLNSPWGLALAPAGFGRLGGALLVGNFGNGRINAFNPKTGAHEGQLRGRTGSRSPSTGCGGCASATATPPRPASCCSAPDRTTSRTVSSARSSPRGRWRGLLDGFSAQPHVGWPDHHAGHPTHRRRTPEPRTPTPP